MARSKKPLPLLENITIEAVAAEGKCLFHWNDLVVFVPFCVPGDVCDIQIRRKKHSFAEGEVVRFVELSKVRAVPFCKHFGVCGGCSKYLTSCIALARLSYLSSVPFSDQ